MPKVMHPFATVDAALRALAYRMRGTVDEFESVALAIIAHAGWNPREFFDVRRGNVIEAIDSAQ